MEAFHAIFQKYIKLYDNSFESAVRTVETLVEEHPSWLKDSQNFYHHAAWFGIAAGQLECKMVTYRPYRKIRFIIMSNEPIRFSIGEIVKSNVPSQPSYAAFLKKYELMAEKSMAIPEFKGR
jgi:hypothetical protein